LGVGRFVRVLGTHLADNETVHQSAIDRLKYPECAYNAPNLKSYLANADIPPPANTTRITRGKPCDPLPPRVSS
jgi:hypothetical protein